jgi:hypothetical protein
MKRTLHLSLLIFLPATFIGAIGGLLGAMFIFMHLKASKFRRRLFSCFGSPTVQNILKLIEVLVIAVSINIIYIL